MAEEDQVEDQATTEEPGGVTVEIAEEKGKPRLSDEEAARLADEAMPPEDEIGKYHKDAQRRIKNLHIAGQEWRRRAAQSTRDVATATTLAEQLYRENQQLKANQTRSEAALIDQAIRRAEAQLAAARDHAKAAITAQDTDAQVAANEEVSRFVSEVDRLRLLRPAAEKADTAGAEGAAPAPPLQAPPPAPRPVSEGVKRWIEKNAWFGKPGEEEITGFALGVHQALERQGVTEESDPSKYWDTINGRLKEKYPERFKPPPTRPVAVTGGTRVNGDAGGGSGGNRKHVVMTESQVRIAHSLGLTNEQYATQLVKEETEREREKARTTVQ
jgi:hypothetical protein